jgi:hypothetical protein
LAARPSACRARFSGRGARAFRWRRRAMPTRNVPVPVPCGSTRIRRYARAQCQVPPCAARRSPIGALASVPGSNRRRVALKSFLASLLSGYAAGARGSSAIPFSPWSRRT